MSEPKQPTVCELYINRSYGAEEGQVVRIEARHGSKLLGRIEVSLVGFAEALMGTGAVPAQFSTVRLGRALIEKDSQCLT